MSRNSLIVVSAVVVGGLGGVLATGWLLDQRWHTPVTLALLMLIGSLVLVTMQRHARIMISRINSTHDSHVAKANANIAEVSELHTLVTRIERQNHANEIRLRQLGQITNLIEANTQQSATADKENEARLRQIGQIVKKIQESQTDSSKYVPMAQRLHTVGQVTAGRLAAAVSTDASRSDRLLMSLERDTFPQQANGSGRKIGIIGTSELHDVLGSIGIQLCSYFPSLSVAQNKNYVPSAVIIEEAALSSGAWTGALSSGGLLLYDEICQILGWAETRGIPAYFIRNTGIPDIQTNDLVSQTVTITGDMNLEEVWSEGMPFAFLETLRNYSGQRRGES